MKVVSENERGISIEPENEKEEEFIKENQEIITKINKKYLYENNTAEIRHRIKEDLLRYMFYIKDTQGNILCGKD